MRISKITLFATAAGALALAGCATLEEEIVDATSTTHHAHLMGSNVVGGGDPDGMGDVEISVSDELGQVCWDVNDIRNIGPITGIHVHRGAAGVNGPVVFPLEMSNEGGIQGCADASQWAQDLIEGAPGAFYVQAHTAEYPNGAIRGQLMNRDD